MDVDEERFARLLGYASKHVPGDSELYVEDGDTGRAIVSKGEAPLGRVDVDSVELFREVDGLPCEHVAAMAYVCAVAASPRFCFVGMSGVPGAEKLADALTLEVCHLLSPFTHRARFFTWWVNSRDRDRLVYPLWASDEGSGGAFNTFVEARLSVDPVSGGASVLLHLVNKGKRARIRRHSSALRSMAAHRAALDGLLDAVDDAECEQVRTAFPAAIRVALELDGRLGQDPCRSSRDKRAVSDKARELVGSGRFDDAQRRVPSFLRPRSREFGRFLCSVKRSCVDAAAAGFPRDILRSKRMHAPTVPPAKSCAALVKDVRAILIGKARVVAARLRLLWFCLRAGGQAVKAIDAFREIRTAGVFVEGEPVHTVESVGVRVPVIGARLDPIFVRFLAQENGVHSAPTFSASEYYTRLLSAFGMVDATPVLVTCDVSPLTLANDDRWERRLDAFVSAFCGVEIPIQCALALAAATMLGGGSDDVFRMATDLIVAVYARRLPGGEAFAPVRERRDQLGRLIHGDVFRRGFVVANSYLRCGTSRSGVAGIPVWSCSAVCGVLCVHPLVLAECMRRLGRSGDVAVAPRVASFVVVGAKRKRDVAVEDSVDHRQFKQAPVGSAALLRRFLSPNVASVASPCGSCRARYESLVRSEWDRVLDRVAQINEGARMLGVKAMETRARVASYLASERAPTVIARLSCMQQDVVSTENLASFETGVLDAVEDGAGVADVISASRRASVVLPCLSRLVGFSPGECCGCSGGRRSAHDSLTARLEEASELCSALGSSASSGSEEQEESLAEVLDGTSAPALEQQVLLASQALAQHV